MKDFLLITACARVSMLLTFVVHLCTGGFWNAVIRHGCIDLSLVGMFGPSGALSVISMLPAINFQIWCSILDYMHMFFLYINTCFYTDGKYDAAFFLKRSYFSFDNGITSDVCSCIFIKIMHTDLHSCAVSTRDFHI